MSYRRYPKRVEDYTDAFLVSGGVALLLVLMVVWASLGFFWALLAAWGVDRLIRQIGRRTA